LRILIDGLSGRAGGGLTYLRYMLPALVSEAPQHQFRVLLSPRYQADVLSRVPHDVELERTNLPPRPLWRRVLFLRGERVPPSAVPSRHDGAQCAPLRRHG
jgi:hypothetical protein